MKSSRDSHTHETTTVPAAALSAVTRINPASPPASAGESSAPQDMTRWMLPDKSATQLAQDLLGKYPDADRALLLELMTSNAFFAMRFGNKREERAACEYLNLLQAKAAHLSRANQKKEAAQ